MMNKYDKRLFTDEITFLTFNMMEFNTYNIYVGRTSDYDIHNTTFEEKEESVALTFKYIISFELKP